MTTPCIPSSMIWSPFLTISVMASRPTTAGISRDFAMMAVCEVLPPMSVAKPRTRPLCMVAVSEGERS